MLTSRSNQQFSPLTASLAGAMTISGMSRSAIYKELALGNLRAVKAGRKTLILVESLEEYLSKLPAAQFRAKAA